MKTKAFFSISLLVLALCSVIACNKEPSKKNSLYWQRDKLPQIANLHFDFNLVGWNNKDYVSTSCKQTNEDLASNDIEAWLGKVQKYIKTHSRIYWSRQLIDKADKFYSFNYENDDVFGQINIIVRGDKNDKRNIFFYLLERPKL